MYKLDLPFSESLVVRQHVNPLSSYFQIPREISNPEDLFADPRLPIHLDIGCARGQFLFSMASLNDQSNYLGLEIRHPLVIAAERERLDLGLDNLRFIFCNVNVSLENWLIRIPENLLKVVSIQFPDPWFKKRHHKRRVLNHSLLNAFAKALSKDSQLFIQTDVLEVMEPISKLIDSNQYFTLSSSTKFISGSPFSVRTERETYAIEKSLPIYRVTYFRNSMAWK